ncbi:hypothetical protein PROFUN_13165 [Planoprotostelium fungivorum]|uniref:Uncharacterized protein n=1 Tax=Planoprotostelium fungivorum TaxID=1890364 RepID=A0A2P6N579_9EUKA|nr:hypothetical protein PROFUN_13165 [Planoprotostelium fungivorum]
MGSRELKPIFESSLLSQKQVRKLVVMPRVELPGLHGGIFSFFVWTNIAEKSVKYTMRALF